MTEPARPTTEPTEAATDQEVAATVNLAHELGQLKLLPRTGWMRAGVERPESIADHSMRAAALAWMLAGLEGASQERAAALALFHDSQETRTTDLDHLSQRYVEAAPNERITAEQARDLPEPLATGLRGLVAEYEERGSLEAACARDADKLEMLLQAVEYRARGHGDTGPFMGTALAALRTASGRRLAEAAMKLDPTAWWRVYAPDEDDGPARPDPAGR
jgi:putative hydrolase of HD superfamily